MNNPYCAPFDHVRGLFVAQQKRFAWERFTHWTRIFTRPQIKEQLDTQKGEMVDDLRASIKSRSNTTEFAELIGALQLADFYFPDREKQICFELRRGVDAGKISTLEDLVGAFEDSTHIDCLVRAGKEKVAFQIKRYRGENTHEAFVQWLREKVLKRYGNMSGTVLVIFIQSISGATTPLALDKLYELFTKDAAQEVTFDEVALIYNSIADKAVVLHKLFPIHKRLLIPSDWAMARIRGDV